MSTEKGNEDRRPIKCDTNTLNGRIYNIKYNMVTFFVKINIYIMDKKEVGNIFRFSGSEPSEQQSIDYKSEDKIYPVEFLENVAENYSCHGHFGVIRTTEMKSCNGSDYAPRSTNLSPETDSFSLDVQGDVEKECLVSLRQCSGTSYFQDQILKDISQLFDGEMVHQTIVYEDEIEENCSKHVEVENSEIKPLTRIAFMNSMRTNEDSVEVFEKQIEHQTPPSTFLNLHYVRINNPPLISFQNQYDNSDYVDVQNHNTNISYSDEYSSTFNGLMEKCLDTTFQKNYPNSLENSSTRDDGKNVSLQIPIEEIVKISQSEEISPDFGISQTGTISSCYGNIKQVEFNRSLSKLSGSKRKISHTRRPKRRSTYLGGLHLTISQNDKIVNTEHFLLSDENKDYGEKIAECPIRDEMLHDIKILFEEPTKVNLRYPKEVKYYSFTLSNDDLSLNELFDINNSYVQHDSSDDELYEAKYAMTSAYSEEEKVDIKVSGFNLEAPYDGRNENCSSLSSKNSDNKSESMRTVGEEPQYSECDSNIEDTIKTPEPVYNVNKFRGDNIDEYLSDIQKLFDVHDDFQMAVCFKHDPKIRSVSSTSSGESLNFLEEVTSNDSSCVFDDVEQFDKGQRENLSERTFENNATLNFKSFLSSVNDGKEGDEYKLSEKGNRDDMNAELEVSSLPFIIVSDDDLTPPPIPPKSKSSREKKSSQSSLDENARHSLPPALPPKLSKMRVNKLKISSMIDQNFTSFENDVRLLKAPNPGAIGEISNRQIFNNIQLPNFTRSMSTEAYIKNKVNFMNDSGVRSEPSTIGRSGKCSVGIDIKSNARMQHFPVALDSTHHRLSEVTAREEIGSNSSFDNDSFTFSNKDGKVETTVNRNIDTFYRDEKSGNDSSPFEDHETINPVKWDPRVLKHSSSTRISNKFKREIPMYQRGASIKPKKTSFSSSSSYLLEDSLTDETMPQPGESTEPKETKSVNDSIKNITENCCRRSKSIFQSFNRVSMNLVTMNLKAHWNKFSSHSTPHEGENFQRSQSDRIKNKIKLKERDERSKSSLGDTTIIRKSFVKNPSAVTPLASNSSNSWNDVAGFYTEDEIENLNNPIFINYQRQHSNDSSTTVDYSPASTRSLKSEQSTRLSNLDLQRSSIIETETFENDAQRKRNSSSFCEKSSALKASAITALMDDMNKYTNTLIQLQETYSIMRKKTPDGIRQHFDQAFNQIESMIHLQNKLNDIVRESNCDAQKIALGFLTDDFAIYKKYTVLANTIQKEMKNHSKYFQENFQDLATKIILPSLRLNTYAMHFRHFQDIFCAQEQENVKEAIAHLESLKDQANTEMTVNIIQNCPVELRLSGLIKHTGELYYERTAIKKNLLKLIVFEELIVIAENKFDFLIYRCHLRSGQLLEVTKVNDFGLTLKVTRNYLIEYEYHKFKAITQHDRDQWFKFLHSWMETNRSSYPNTPLNSELKENLPPSPDKFWPLNLWRISSNLKNVVDRVKFNKNTFETSIDLQQKPFEYLIKEEEKFIEKLNRFLDPEAMPPPPILGSILRKLRRFHNGCFLPQLKEAYSKNPTNVLDCFIGNLPNFPPLYKEFIEVRSGLTLLMQDGENVRLYISPFVQLSHYVEWLYNISLMPKYHSKVKGELTLLLNCIEDSRVSLLHSAIPKAKLDFYKSGDILLKGFLESRIKTRNLKVGYQYYVILFEKMIVFTKLNLPHYDFVQEIWLDQMTLGPNTLSDMCFKIEEKTHRKEHVYELKGETKSERNQWFQSISKLLNNQAEQIRKKILN